MENNPTFSHIYVFFLCCTLQECSEQLLPLIWHKDMVFLMPYFRYDLVDVTRQSLEVIAIKYYTDLMTAYSNRDYDTTV